MAKRQQRWDIFCRVIDNFGDIGVCWRLAKQLHNEYGLQIRLWVDDLSTAQKLLPEIDLALAEQNIHGVAIHHWHTNFVFDDVADVVIEAFACELPDNYLNTMVAKQPIWLNLEYLSAESWVDDLHLNPSPHPRMSLKKTFYFPGFTENTGGLLREKSLIAEREAFQSQSEHSIFWGQDEIADHPIKVSLFAYPHAPIHALLNAMATSKRPVLCLAPESSILPMVSDFFGETLRADDCKRQDNLMVKVLPFLSQQAYDQLLWSCDLNFVRGEDSWIRAMWAAKPFVWLPYQQTEDTHLIKLQAFLQRYTQTWPAEVAEPYRQFHTQWASEQFDTTAWQALTSQLAGLETLASKEAKALAQQPDLAAKLVIFCENFS
jgi:uncharacterized repeat protein (TIGR03837 family)